MQTSRHIFFVGIGGKGLNGIAKMCLEKGYIVSGVDVSDKPEIHALREMGATIFNKHAAANISSDVRLVVYTSLVNNSCPEIVYAQHHGIETIKRAEFLHRLTKNDFRISISGSHGKSTTTALVGLSLINSNIDASIYGGAYTKEFHSYNHRGKSKYTVIESCEYDRSFFHLTGDLTVITSIEKSHLEYYKDEAEMVEAFQQFITKHKPSATLIVNGDDSTIRRITHNCHCNVIYFGFDVRNDYVIGDVLQTQHGSTFSVFKKNKKVLNNVTIHIPGTYNMLNFTAASVIVDVLGLSQDGVIETAKHFTGVGRRFEITTLDTGQVFIDDFAHHPTQVKNLFVGIQQFFPKRKTYAIFQPRQYNLMKNFLSEYGAAFAAADEVIMTDIVPGLGDTDQDMHSVTAQQMAESIQTRSGVPVRIMTNLEDIAHYISDVADSNSVITTIGAGDIYKVRDLYMKHTMPV